MVDLHQFLQSRRDNSRAFRRSKAGLTRTGHDTPAPGKRHRSSSWQIPAVKPEIVTTKDTGSWRVVRKEPVTAATQVLPADAATMAPVLPMPPWQGRT